MLLSSRDADVRVSGASVSQTQLSFRWLLLSESHRGGTRSFISFQLRLAPTTMTTAVMTVLHDFGGTGSSSKTADVETEEENVAVITLKSS